MKTFVFPDNWELSFAEQHADCFIKNEVAVRLLHRGETFMKSAETRIKRKTYKKMFSKDDEVVARYICFLINKLIPNVQ